MSRIVWRGLPTVLVIALLRSPAVGDPTQPDTPHHDPDGATTDSPWIDQGPTPVLALTSAKSPNRDHKLAAALTLGGLYAGFIGWTYLAWYRRPSHEFRWADPKTDGSWRVWSEDGWFGKNGYAGGADKMGHLWATLALARLGTEMLDQWGGYDRLTAAIVGTALSEALFFGVELRDGTSYSFSKGDFTFDTLGAALAFAQSVWPRVDELFDFRVEYFPSSAYRAQFEKKTDLDVAEDYSGQTYHLAFHLGAIHPLRDWRYGSWSRYVDLTLGFETRGYKPDPTYPIYSDVCMMYGENCDFHHERNLFFGLTLNAQGLFDTVLRDRSEIGRKLTHGAFEVFSIPYTTVRMAERTAVPDGPIPDEQ